MSRSAGVFWFSAKTKGVLLRLGDIFGDYLT